MKADPSKSAAWGGDLKNLLKQVGEDIRFRVSGLGFKDWGLGFRD